MAFQAYKHKLNQTAKRKPAFAQPNALICTLHVGAKARREVLSRLLINPTPACPWYFVEITNQMPFNITPVALRKPIPFPTPTSFSPFPRSTDEQIARSSAASPGNPSADHGPSRPAPVIGNRLAPSFSSPQPPPVPSAHGLPHLVKRGRA